MIFFIDVTYIFPDICRNANICIGDILKSDMHPFQWDFWAITLRWCWHQTVYPRGAVCLRWFKRSLRPVLWKKATDSINFLIKQTKKTTKKVLKTCITLLYSYGVKPLLLTQHPLPVPLLICHHGQQLFSFYCLLPTAVVWIWCVRRKWNAGADRHWCEPRPHRLLQVLLSTNCCINCT